MSRVEKFPEINKRACPFIRHLRVVFIKMNQMTKPLSAKTRPTHPKIESPLRKLTPGLVLKLDLVVVFSSFVYTTSVLFSQFQFSCFQNFGKSKNSSKSFGEIKVKFTIKFIID